jgi:integrase
MDGKTKAPTKVEVRELLKAVRDMADRLEAITKLRLSEVQQLGVDELEAQDWILSPRRAEWLEQTTEAMDALKRIRKLLS